MFFADRDFASPLGQSRHMRIASLTVSSGRKHHELDALTPACSVPNTARFTLVFTSICTAFAMPLVVADRVKIQPFDFFSSPVRLAKEFQTAVDAWIVVKAIDVDALTQSLPTILSNQVLEDRFERNSV